MNINYYLSLALVATVCSTLAGCGAELLTTTAIRGELDAQQAKSAARQLEYVKGKVGDINIEQAIQAYRAEHGANPVSLDALVPQYLPRIPAQPDGSPYHYDPATGTISGMPVAAGPAPEDIHMLSAIRAAINEYGTTTGYFPPTLDDLYPQYLGQQPRTATGQPFLYNNQNGHVAHPAQQATPRTPHHPDGTRPTHVGAGPMGEVMTGVGIQQELGRMNTSGASAAQSRARGGAQDTSNQHTDRQNQVMDQLGL